MNRLYEGIYLSAFDWQYYPTNIKNFKRPARYYGEWILANIRKEI